MGFPPSVCHLELPVPSAAASCSSPWTRPDNSSKLAHSRYQITIQNVSKEEQGYIQLVLEDPLGWTQLDLDGHQPYLLETLLPQAHAVVH